jgi:hypothetical protein
MSLRYIFVISLYLIILVKNSVQTLTENSKIQINGLKLDHHTCFLTVVSHLL